MMKHALAGAMVLATLTCGVAQARDNTAAILGGVAAGALGGAVISTMLNNNHAPAPPPPAPVYVQTAPIRPAVVEVEPYRPAVREVAVSPFDDEAYDLKSACDRGNRHACIRFGIMIGKHRERVATWRRTHPDFFSYED